MTITITHSEVLGLAAVRALAATGRARAIREQARLSIRDVSAAVGVSATAVHRWERGEQLPHGAPAQRYYALMAALAQQVGEPLEELREAAAA